MTPDAVIISIRQHFAEAILAGEKSFELRRLRPGFGASARVFIYVPLPSQKIVGWFDVAEVLEAAPPRLWRSVRGACALSRCAFNAYFDGAPVGFALRITKFQRFGEPLSLPAIRKVDSDFTPPQGYQYLRPDRPRDRRLHRRILHQSATA